MAEEELDICMSCGKTHASELWGASCTCDAPDTVHLMECNGCGSYVGVITDDDYCRPTKLFCNKCINQAENKNHE